MWELLVEQTVLSKEALDVMKSVVPISSGWGKGYLLYGAGLFVQGVDYKQLPPEYPNWGSTLGHGGDTYGFISDQGYIPQLDAVYSYVGNIDTSLTPFELTCGIMNTAVKTLRMPSLAPLHCASFEQDVIV